MEQGKVPENILKRMVFGNLGSDRSEVVLGSALGEDCGAVSVEEDEILVLSTDPITGTSMDIGRLSCIVTLNDIATSGAEPIGLLITLLLPPGCTEEELFSIAEDIDDICKETNVSVIGGHTEVTPVVNQPLISVTGVGKVKKDKMILTSGAEPGMEILITKAIGLEGTSIIAKEKEGELLERFPAKLIDTAKAFDRELSILDEAGIAKDYGAASMHDITEGGILKALWEMAEASGVGVDVFLGDIPVRQETIEICEYYDINPYKLISSGSLLIASHSCKEIKAALAKEGIASSIIGKCTSGNDRVVHYDENTQYITPQDADELYKVIQH